MVEVGGLCEQHPPCPASWPLSSPPHGDDPWDGARSPACEEGRLVVGKPSLFIMVIPGVRDICFAVKSNMLLLFWK